MLRNICKKLKKQDGNLFRMDNFFYMSAWNSVGITTSVNEKGANKYVRNCQEISRQDALIYLMRESGRLVNLDDYI